MEKYTELTSKAQFRQAQAGDRASLNALMRKHEPLVHWVAQRQWRGALSYAEVVQAGRLGLWHALLKYDVSRGTAFSTYAWPAIAREIWRAVRQAERAVAAPRPEWGRGVESPASAAHWAQTCDLLHAMVARLPEPERQLVRQYYGLDGKGGCTQQTLGAARGCTRQAISYHLRKAVRRLRHPGWSGALRAHLHYNQRAAYRAARQGQP